MKRDPSPRRPTVARWASLALAGLVACGSEPGPAKVPDRYAYLVDVGGRVDAEAAAAALPFDSISLERQACFGTCPVYTVVFGRDRRAELRGTRFLEQTGAWEGHVGTHDMGRLSFMVERFDVLAMDPLYTAHTTDVPTATLRIWRRGARTPVQIDDEGGVGPAELVAVMTAVDALRGATRWLPADSAAAGSVACSFPVPPTRDLHRDTLSPISRCRAILTARMEMVRRVTYGPDSLAVDTGRIAAASVFDTEEVDGTTGIMTRIRRVELHVHGRPRHLGISIDRRTGRVLQGRGSAGTR
jgi:hypothetical protein